MKITFDKEVDILYIRFSNEKIAESDGDLPGIIIDYDINGKIVAIEILNASLKVKQPNKFEYEVAY